MTSPIANALTIDVEDYFHVSALAGAISKREWNTLPGRVERNTSRLLDMLEPARIRATFFILGWVAERYPRLIKDIHSRGHEIACHGMEHELIYNQSPEEFRRETAQAKRVLEDLIGAPILGYRAASYSITKDSEWALDVIAEAGFRYDSSIVPVRHDLYGMPDAEAAPHKHVTRGGAQIVEFPPTTYRFLGTNWPVGGGGYFRLYPYAMTRYLLARVNEVRREPFIFYLHPWEIDPDQPRVKANLLSTFRHYLNLDVCESRLARLLRDFSFTNVVRVLEELKLLPAD